MREYPADVLVVGGGLGGVAAALAAARAGRTVVLTEGDRWLGGQLTAQAVPPDEHPWVERFGVTAGYRELRDGIRAYYRRYHPLTGAARRAPALNPGAGWVSKLCHEPKVAAAVIDGLLAPFTSARRIVVLRPYAPVRVTIDHDTIGDVLLENTRDGEQVVVRAAYVLDATETGELLPLAGVEHVTGAEGRHETGEPHAPAVADPLNMQAVSWCFAVDHVDGDHTIDRPVGYDRWREYRPAFWPDRLLSWSWPDPRTLRPVTGAFIPNPDDDPLAVVADQSATPGAAELWTYRRVLARRLFEPGFAASDVTLVNWPMIDYLGGSVIGEDSAKHLSAARELSLSALYWMQTEAPRPDGGTGYPRLRLRPDVTGTDTGLAQDVYVRESRRIRALTTIAEQDISMAVRGDHGAVRYRDSVGVGMYRIDLHPSTGGDNYIDVGCSPFQIPLGALLPVRVRNLIAAAKNIGTTHITNGCYRVHPVEWNIGEAAGALAAHCLDTSSEPHAVHADDGALGDFQRRLTHAGVELDWPDVRGY
jgi:hypothetical protein